MPVGDNQPYKLLFVCTGNICRSPMAEGIARDYGPTRLRPIDARSAGTMGLEGQGADPKSIAVCNEIDVDISDHRAQKLTQEQIDWADHILVMEFAHLLFVRERFTNVGERAFLLGTFGGMGDIADPIGSWKYKFRRSRDEIRRCVEQFVDRLPPRGV